MALNIYQIVTDAILEKLEQGVVPWRKSYQGVDLPARNFLSKKRYTGVNILLLSMTGHRSPYWLTFKQAEKLNGKVKKGSKSVRIVFAKTILYKDEKDEEQIRQIFRYSNVFNLDDIEGIECPMKEETAIVKREVTYIENCENVLNDLKERKRIPPIIYHDLQIASYTPMLDIIKSCKPEFFISDEEYYGTLFHEITHSTGHKSRLNRNLSGSKSSKQYAKEELIAEIGACFLCSITGIQSATLDNSVAYINGWMQRIKDDKTLISSAASQAQKAIDFLGVIGIETEDNTED